MQTTKVLSLLNLFYWRHEYRIGSCRNFKRMQAAGYNCQRTSRANTVGLWGTQLNATRSITTGRKILDGAVKSVSNVRPRPHEDDCKRKR